MTQDKLTFVAFPATDNAAETLLCVGLGSGLSINSKTKYPAEDAKKFIAFMMAAGQHQRLRDRHQPGAGDPERRSSRPAMWRPLTS